MQVCIQGEPKRGFTLQAFFLPPFDLEKGDLLKTQRLLAIYTRLCNSSMSTKQCLYAYFEAACMKM